ncbi:MAG: molecular chaperone TorD family protein [Desulfoarculaceae bacterium]|nr:molecular chaperone TorD family protein [Desulfoarculaceae bacterium]
MSTDIARPDLARSDAYRLLAACFYEPDPELLLEENLCANLAMLMEELSVPAAESCCRLEQGLKDSNQGDLLVDYSALFLDPFGAPAQPYGSVHLEKERQLMGDSTMKVRKIYDEAGVRQETDGPPDHIAIELEFMSFLGQRIAQAIAVSDQAAVEDFSAIEAGFFNTYLASWAPLLGRAIQEHAQLTFYRALGECLLAFIGAEQLRLQKSAVSPSP